MVRALLYASDMAHLKISTVFATLLLLAGTAAAQQGAPGAPSTPYPGPPPPPPVAQPQPAPAPPPPPPVAQPQPTGYPAPQPTGYPAPQPQPTGYPAPQPQPSQAGYPPPPPQQGYAPPMYAPPQPTGPPVTQRQGWTFGLSIGAGTLDGEGDSLEGIAFDMHVGFMAGPQFAILLEGYGVSHIEENNGLTQSMGLIAGQYWINPQLWVKGGLGTGRLSLQNSEGVTVEESEDGVAVMFAAGYEIMHSEKFAVDLQLRTGAVSYDDDLTIAQTAASVGVNWY